MAVRKRAGGWEACSAPSETTDSVAAKAFGLIAEGLITLHYKTISGGLASAQIWTDVLRLGGGADLKNFLVKTNQASPQAIDSYFVSPGMAETVPDIIDARSDVWYEIKPASRDGFRAAARKKANIVKFMAAIGLPYQPGKPGKATNGRVNLLPKLPAGFGNFLQMMTSRLGGIKEIKIELVFRCGEPMLDTAGNPDSGQGIIVYRVCVSVKFNDQDADNDEAAASAAQNIARWATVFVFRAAGGATPDGNKPLDIQVDNKDEQIRRMFQPSDVLLVSTILRASPSASYSVCGGALAKQALDRDSANQRFLANVFNPPLMLDPGRTIDDAEMWAIIGVAAVAAVIVVGVVVVIAFPEVVAGAAAYAAAAGRVLTTPAGQRAVAKMAADGAKLLVESPTGVEGAGTLFRMESAGANAARLAAEMSLRTSGTAAITQTVAKAGAGAAGLSSFLYVIGSSTEARAAPRVAGTAPGQPAPAVTSTVQLTAREGVQMIPWLLMSGLGFASPVVGTGPDATAKFPKQREQVSGSGLQDATLLYTIAVKNLPELFIPFFESFPSDD